MARSAFSVLTVLFALCLISASSLIRADDVFCSFTPEGLVCDTEIPVYTAPDNLVEGTCFYPLTLEGVPLEGGLLCASSGANLNTCQTPGMSVGDRCEYLGQICTVIDPNYSPFLFFEGSFQCEGSLGLSVGGCTGPDRIVQRCIASTVDPSALPAITQDAIDRVIADHELPAEGADWVMFYARDSVRAYLFDSIIAAIRKEQRTADEDRMVAYYESELRNLRVRQARIAQAEYNKFRHDPCQYTSPDGPAGFSFEPDPAYCFGGVLAQLFGTPGHPTVEQFESFGMAEVAEIDVLNNPGALEVSGRMRSATLMGIGLGIAAGGVLGAGLLMATVSPAIVVSILTVTAPYSLVLNALSLVSGVISGIVGVVGAVGIVLFAIMGIIVSSINIATEAEFHDHMQNLVLEVEATFPDLRTEIDTDRGVMELYQMFVQSTLPDDYAETAPPHGVDTTAFFRLEDASGAHLADSPTIDLLLPQDQVDLLEASGFSSPTLTVRLYKGWFAPTLSYENAGGETIVDSRLSLNVQFVNWSGSPETAWRRGEEFMIPQLLDVVTSTEPHISGELQFKDVFGQDRVARILTDPTPPVITPVVTGSMRQGNDWYYSDVDLEWTIEEPDSDLSNVQGCDSQQFTVDGIYDLECSADSMGGSSSVPLTIKRDATPPGVVRVVTPEANSNNWYNVPVTVSYECTDNLSGVADCPSASTYQDSGAVWLINSPSAFDVAGNQSFPLGLLSLPIDQTDPVVQISSPADGAIFLLNEVVASDWSVSDALSGVAVSNGTVADGLNIDTSSPGLKAFTVNATDRADNTNSLTHHYTVLTPQEAVLQLEQLLLELHLENRAEEFLLQQLVKIRELLEIGDLEEAMIRLEKFIKHVESEKPKTIDAAAKEVLVAAAQQILDSVNSLSSGG